MTKAIVDTHALIWFLEKSPNLGKRAKETLLAPESELIIPVIVLGEIFYYLRKKKKAHLYGQIYGQLKMDARISIEPLQPEIISSIPEGLEMHDGLIAAHCMLDESSVILSRDGQLKKWKNNRLVWD